jgi:ABC-type nitrate/sulfonate/bicarbonate transport system permease component
MISLGLLVVSEMLGSHDGIGFEVLQAQQSYRIAEMWAGVLLLGILGFLMSKMFDLIEHHTLRWHAARRRSFAAGSSR